jgi:hypothetical protein
MWYYTEAEARFPAEEARPRPDTRTWPGRVQWGDWQLWRLARGIRRSGIFAFLEHSGKFTILIAAIFFLFNNLSCLKREQRIREAWTVVTSQEGRRSSGGRIEAIRTLHTLDVSLSGLTAPEAYLGGLSVPGANLQDSELSNAILVGADLRGADLTRANLIGCDLREARLEGAILSDARLENADLSSATGITEEQLEKALTDSTTRKPTYLADAESTVN